MEFVGKETTFVADWLEKQGLAKLKAFFEKKAVFNGTDDFLSLLLWSIIIVKHAV